MSKFPSPEEMTSRITIAPSCPKDICSKFPILKMVFYNSAVFICPLTCT